MFRRINIESIEIGCAIKKCSILPSNAFFDTLLNNRKNYIYKNLFMKTLVGDLANEIDYFCLSSRRTKLDFVGLLTIFSLVHVHF